MDSKPILFSEEMVKAILDGQKTMTRRILKAGFDAHSMSFQSLHQYQEKNLSTQAYFIDKYDSGLLGTKCPYGKIGDELWVRENHKIYINFDSQIYVGFSGDDKFDVYNVRDISFQTMEKINNRSLKKNEWHSCPSIHLYKEFSRIKLVITDIRVEKIQDITNDDAKAEGASNMLSMADFDLLKGIDPNYVIKRPFLEYQFGFLALWAKINGVKSWTDNPYVWVISFKKKEVKDGK